MDKDIAIRTATPRDAEKIIEYIRRLLREPVSNMELSEGEFTLTAEEEQAVLESYGASETSTYLVAEHGTRIVGLLQCKGSRRSKTRHSVSLGMSVDQDYRNQGIGSRLLTYAINWARGTGFIKRIELLVFETNENAIHLYKKMGFEVEGRKRKGVFRDGVYVDELVMGLLL